MAGLGNIYVCEALFRAGIHPRKAGGKGLVPALRRLVPAMREVLTQSIVDGGSTLRDYAAPDGQLGYFATRFAVYGREGEPCSAPIARQRAQDTPDRPGRSQHMVVPALPEMRGECAIEQYREAGDACNSLTQSSLRAYVACFPAVRRRSNDIFARTGLRCNFARVTIRAATAGRYMANTPQAKKRIRRNNRRAEVNGARISRIRTFLKRVEAAIESGNADDAEDCPACRTARTGTRCGPRRVSQEHGIAEDVASVEARLCTVTCGPFRLAATRGDSPAPFIGPCDVCSSAESNKPVHCAPAFFVQHA